MLKTKQKKKKEEERKESCSCQLCGRVTSVKTPPYHGASSPWAYMRIFTPSLWSLWTEDTDVLLQRTSSVFCSESIRCEPMPLFRGETFFVVIQTTSKHWARWSLYLPCSLSRDEAGVRLLWVRPLRGTWPVYFFLYWGWCGEWAQSKAWKQKGRTCGLMLWSERPFFACEFV